MNGKNEVLDLSFHFAVRIVNLCKYLQKELQSLISLLTSISISAKNSIQ